MPAHPFIPVPNTASVEFIYQNAGEVNENVIHVEKGSPFTLSDLQTLRGVCDTWDNGHNNQLRDSGATLVRIRTKALDTNSSPTEDYFLPTPRAGALGGSPQASLNVAMCAKLATGIAGRSFRGRWFCGNLSMSQMTDAGHMSTGTQTAIVTHLTALLTALAGAGYTWVVTSFYTAGAWRTTGLNTPITTVVVVDRNLDSQRRRLPGRGH